VPNLLKKWLEREKSTGPQGPTSVELVRGRDGKLVPDTFEVSAETARLLRVSPPIEVSKHVPPRYLELPGSLAFDPNRLGRVQSRFPGEVVELVKHQPRPRPVGLPPRKKAPGTGDDYKVEPPPSPDKGPRPYQYGDYVLKGDLMAVVWSKDLGEKKSELVDAMVKLSLDLEALRRLEDAAREGVVPQAILEQARNTVSADLNTVAKARRTLQTWRIDSKDIEEIEAEARLRLKGKSRREAERVLEGNSQAELAREKKVIERWARVEVRAPFNGIVVEKGVTLGSIVDTSTDLYKVADMRELSVFANAYEEDLPRLRKLEANLRKNRQDAGLPAALLPWEVFLGAGNKGKALSSPGIERIGYVVDPSQHTNLVIGLVHAGGTSQGPFLSVGQFVVARVKLEPPNNVVSVPIDALVEDGQESAVFVQEGKWSPKAKKFRFALRRVAVTQRFEGQAYVKKQLSDEERRSGLEELTPGERIVVGGAVELKAALEEAQARAQAQAGK
jgi:cobalt-zinc-cadmium efflux system membrane fusion protein